MGLSPHGRGIPPSHLADQHNTGPIPAWAGDTGVSTSRGRPVWAYPRMGGGYKLENQVSTQGQGLSPHGRGIQLRCLVQLGRAGPIPAWAGDTSTSTSTTGFSGAYPRMGGGYASQTLPGSAYTGLSPHGRGIPARIAVSESYFGPIPAWAGDTRPCCARYSLRRAYPRMGGGYCNGSCSCESPRGLSPHGRGIQINDRLCFAPIGPIPAWAGDTRGVRRGRRACRAYPRMGGGYTVRSWATIPVSGLSPHGRGIQDRRDFELVEAGPIPAWAGDTEGCAPADGAVGAYPRMGGGYIANSSCLMLLEGLSPHGRGILVGVRDQDGEHGPIPAWAGDTTWNSICVSRIWAYPRMGGGYAAKASAKLYKLGLSPHGRGIHPYTIPNGERLGPIPAWAGDTSQLSMRMRMIGAYPRMGGGYDAELAAKPASAGLSPHGRGIRQD